jgi:antibiotic biosynthesis monooxygenase (ABM) superfamily enzyme
VSGEAGVPAASRKGPVTSTVTRQVRPGHSAAYEIFLQTIIECASGFDGYLGAEIFRPVEPEHGGEYRIVYRFASVAQLRAWLDSAEHSSQLELAVPHAVGASRTSFRTGLETWFTLPGEPGLPPPTPYKMAVLTWLSIFPLISLVVLVLGPHIRTVALVPRTAITTAVTVPLMTWIVMPRVTWLLRSWLFSRSATSPPSDD